MLGPALIREGRQGLRQWALHAHRRGHNGPNHDGEAIHDHGLIQVVSRRRPHAGAPSLLGSPAVTGRPPRLDKRMSAVMPAKRSAM